MGKKRGQYVRGREVRRARGLETAWDLKEIASKGGRERKLEVGTGGGRGDGRRERTVPEHETLAGREGCGTRPPESPAYLATPPGGDALLRAGARERLGRNVQHPGPVARALPGVRRPTG